MATRLPCLLLLLALPAGHAAAQDGITIYRCTDATGELALQDSPCTQGQSQQVRTMLQPVDPPPEPMPAPDPAATAATPPAPEPRPYPAIARAPQPMYECVRPDGSSYVSDSGDGNPRRITTYTSWPSPVYGDGYDGGGGYGITYSRNATATAPAHSSPPTRVDTASGGNGAPQLHFRNVRPPEPPPPPPRPPRPVFDYGYGYDQWVRDECHPLPQAEVCDRLHDRRERIRDRRFNAQQRERETLALEERGISARIAADCGQ